MVLVYLKNLLFPKGGNHSKHETSATKYGTLYSNGNGTISDPLLQSFSHIEGQESHKQPYEPTSSEIESESSSSLLSPRLISDAIIGLSDGLTVPFALTAGLSTFNDTRVVVYGGLAELIAGSISMGLGGWLAARGEYEYYMSTLNSIEQMIANYHAEVSRGSGRGSMNSLSMSSTNSLPRGNEHGNGLHGLDISIPTTPPPSPSLALSIPNPNSPLPKLLTSIFTPYSLPRETLNPLISTLLSPKYPTERLTSFILCFKHTLSAPNPNRATVSALTISLGYFLGGFIPLLPYFFVARTDVMKGLYWSVGVMVLCLAGFGWWKTSVVSQEMEGEFMEEIRGEVGDEETGFGKKRSKGINWEQIKRNLKGAGQMVLVGGFAAGGAMGIVKFLGSMGS